MAKADVQDYTRQLANGTKVHVHGHKRTYDPADDAKPGRSPVDQLRSERLKEQARVRRANALRMGREAVSTGWTATQKRARQSWKLSKKGGKRLRRAAWLASKKKRATATCAAVAGVAEIGAALAWSTTGLIVTTVSILAATLAGGLFLGGKK